MGLIDSNDELSRIYQRHVYSGISEEEGLLLVFDVVVSRQTENFELVQFYKELLKEFQFSPKKMREFAKRDKLIDFVVKDMKSMGYEEEYALQLAFNGYVIEDSTMRDIYKTL